MGVSSLALASLEERENAQSLLVGKPDGTLIVVCVEYDGETREVTVIETDDIGAVQELGKTSETNCPDGLQISMTAFVKTGAVVKECYTMKHACSEELSSGSRWDGIRKVLGIQQPPAAG
jgi:hypothetical protein